MKHTNLNAKKFTEDYRVLSLKVIVSKVILWWKIYYKQLSDVQIKRKNPEPTMILNGLTPLTTSAEVLRELQAWINWKNLNNKKLNRKTVKKYYWFLMNNSIIIITLHTLVVTTLQSKDTRVVGVRWKKNRRVTDAQIIWAIGFLYALKNNTQNRLQSTESK